MTKILLPVEDRYFADAQIDFLAKHDIAPDSIITIVSVSVPFIPPDCGYAIPNPYWETIIIEDDMRRKEFVSDVLKKLRQYFPDADMDGHILHGSAAHEILRFAKEGKFDLIIMGSHGRRGFDKLLLGSVAQSVTSHAPCSVSIIRCVGKEGKKESDTAADKECKVSTAAGVHEPAQVCDSKV